MPLAFDLTRLTSLEAGSPQSANPIIIAEIGTAHAGDLKRGLELIDAAADAGADIVKTQVVFAREILPPEAGLVPLPGGPTPLYEVFRSLEQPPEFYAALAQRAEERGIGFLASPFGRRASLSWKTSASKPGKSPHRNSTTSLCWNGWPAPVCPSF
jgi:sialic acid synthase SpsE